MKLMAYAVAGNARRECSGGIVAEGAMPALVVPPHMTPCKRLSPHLYHGCAPSCASGDVIARIPSHALYCLYGSPYHTHRIVCVPPHTIHIVLSACLHTPYTLYCLEPNQWHVTLFSIVGYVPYKASWLFCCIPGANS